MMASGLTERVAGGGRVGVRRKSGLACSTASRQSSSSLGPVARRRQEICFGLAEGNIPDHPEWRTPVYRKAAATATR